MLKLARRQFLQPPLVENAPPGTAITRSFRVSSSIIRWALQRSGSSNQMNMPSVGTLKRTSLGRCSLAAEIIASRLDR